VGSYVWDGVIDFISEEAGSVQDIGLWAGIYRGAVLKIAEDAAKEQGDTLTTGERNNLRGTTGVIIFENDQGFVTRVNRISSKGYIN